MRGLAEDIIDKFDIEQTNYASSILHGRRFECRAKNKQFRFLGKEEAKRELYSSSLNDCSEEELTMKGKKEPAIHQIIEMMASSPAYARNKIVVIMTDNFQDIWKANLDLLKYYGMRVICVGISVYCKISYAHDITTEDHVVQYYGEIRKEDVLQKVFEGIHGYSLFDKYVQYFKTPYFIFVRDTLSYLALLALHFAVCLQPSALHFTALEWVIMLFFIGRLLMEINQAIVEKQLVIKFRTLLKVATTNGMISRYFSDWWNKLDLVTLLVYIIILILRSITWAEHFSVSNNRLLAVAGYFYGFNTMFLTLRVFGHIMESNSKTGSTQIALFQILGAVVAILGQFLATTLAFSLAITKVYVAEMSYTAGKNSTLHGFCENRSGGIACWWSSATHLIGSLLGLADLGPFQSFDGPSDALAKLLYGIFLIMAVVMLMNMMIALLSNTYQKVQDNAIYEWSYRKATTIRTYRNYHPVPVPFNIISMIFICIRYICTALKQKITNDGRLKSSESSRSSNSIYTLFDCMVRDLQADYWKTHGFELPMADSNKMNLLLKETEGSHQLIGHIANQVYKYNKREAQQLANELGNQSFIWKSDDVEINGHQLRSKARRRHGAQLQIPLSKEWPGFEVLIQEIEDRASFAIGVVPEGYDSKTFPGYEGNSAGYHVEERKVYGIENPTGNPVWADRVAKRGDLLGCRLNYDKIRSDDKTLDVDFSINGNLIGYAKVKKGEDLYSFIWMGCEGITLLFKLCPNKAAEVSVKKDQTEEKLDKLLQKMDELNFKGVKDPQENADRNMEEFHSRVVKDLQDNVDRKIKEFHSQIAADNDDKNRKMEVFHSRVVKDIQDNARVFKDLQDNSDRKMEEFHSRVVKDIQDNVDRTMEEFHSRVVKDLQDDINRLCTEIKSLKDDR